MKPCPVRIVAACPGGALRAVGHTVEVPRRGSVHPMKPRRWPVVFPLRRKRTGAWRQDTASKYVSMPMLASLRRPQRPHGMMAFPGRELRREPGDGRCGHAFAAAESQSRGAALRAVLSPCCNRVPSTGTLEGRHYPWPSRTHPVGEGRRAGYDGKHPPAKLLRS